MLLVTVVKKIISWTICFDSTINCRFLFPSAEAGSGGKCCKQIKNFFNVAKKKKKVSTIYINLELNINVQQLFIKENLQKGGDFMKGR